MSGICNDLMTETMSEGKRTSDGETIMFKNVHDRMFRTFKRKLKKKVYRVNSIIIRPFEQVMKYDADFGLVKEVMIEILKNTPVKK